VNDAQIWQVIDLLEKINNKLDQLIKIQETNSISER